jgi:hypothetical protein
MSGDIAMAAHKITGLPLPTLDPDAATKAYVDAGGGAKFKTLHLTRDLTLADEPIAYTGVGFTPSLLLFYSITDSYNTSSWGFATSPANQRCYFGGFTTPVIQAFADVIWAYDDPLINGGEGWLLTIDPDGFTIGWYKTGIPNGNADFYVICLA